MPKAIIIGSLNMDIVAYVKQQPNVGETIFGTAVKYFAGGKGNNQAVACKRLGCETLMVGRIGDDAFGEQLLTYQQQANIDTSGIKPVTNTPTGTAFITVSENADNTIVVIAGANAKWEANCLADIEINADDIVIAQFEVPDAVIEQAFSKAKACGAYTILNPAPVRPVSNTIKTATDLLVVNVHELASIANMPIDADNDAQIFAAIASLSNAGYQSVVVTLGSQGVGFVMDDAYVRVPARRVKAVDTTGAGDTFIGGLAAGLLSGQTLARAVALGNAAASISVTREGAAQSIPSLAETLALDAKR